MKEYAVGTPQRQLQDALDARYPNAEEFFARIAEELTIRQDSASGTYYGFLAGSRALPKTHRAIYLRDLAINESVLDEIDDGSTRTPTRRDPLAELRAEVAWLREWVTRGFAALGVEPEVRDVEQPTQAADDPRQ